MKSILAATFALAPVVGHAADEAEDPYLLAAEQSGVCGDAGVASATLTEENTIMATCNEDDVTGFVPLFGGLGAGGAAGLIGAAAVVAAVAGAGGNAASDTQ
ncbi:hypothetical protein [Loktanella sp. M215]|uniref:hypothetical protein n=1 Tax=Loktanella sp. M215 TaxID=2675431 RepID=UPI001F3D272F|nr:hypothetical protein [Loktanella sp. M215]MCF7698611.1 hypothetical protein [Loktanella sp. M215]